MKALVVGGGGQQSRCTRPTGDNVEQGSPLGRVVHRQPGGSIRDDQVIETADKYGIVMAFTGMRLFHHG